MFGAGNDARIERAARSAYEAISNTCGPYTRSGIDIVKISKSDAYVSGFLRALLVALSVVSSLEEGISKEDMPKTIMLVRLAMFGQEAAIELTTIADAFKNNGNQEYLLGNGRGKKLQNYMTNVEDISSDPDFVEAVELGRMMGHVASALGESTPPSDEEMALGGLMTLWFSNHMSRYH